MLLFSTDKLQALKDAVSSDNLDAIKSAQEDLQNKFYEVSQKLYQAAQAAGADPNAQQAPGNDAGPDYTDADYTEVDNN